MSARQAVIIGAGIGGIATAIHLAQQGYSVTVLEKNSRPGGRCDRLVKRGHRFDTGPTLLVMPLVYEAEFASMGINLRERLKLQRVDPTYHLVFDDGQQLSLTSDLTRMAEQLEAIEPGSFDGFLRYLEEGRRHYELGMERLVNRDFRSATDFFAVGNLPLLFELKPLVHHYYNMGQYFESARLKSAFTFQDVYMGLSPFEAPATFSMMPYTELAHGVWYPEGGMYSLVELLVDTARQAGVRFRFHAPVESLETDGHIARAAVLQDGSRVEGDVIVANADLPYVYDQLLPDSAEAERLAHLDYSCSVISFFWGVDQPYPQIPPHALFLADDYRANFDSIIEGLTLPDNPSLYVHAPARLDPTAAPAGADTLIGIVPVGHLSDDGTQDWVAIRDRAREAVFDRLRLLGVDDLREHITFEVNFTPLSWRQRYNLMKGATHGLSHTLTQLAYLRPRNRHAHIHNLYFVGASTHPGTGVPTALVSAHLVSERIADEAG